MSTPQLPRPRKTLKPKTQIGGFMFGARLADQELALVRAASKDLGFPNNSNLLMLLATSYLTGKAQ